MRRSHFLSFAFALGCGSHHGDVDRTRFDAVYPLSGPPGISDLAIDDHGTLWAIPERDHVVLEIDKPGGNVVSHPLDGIPDGTDTESLVWLSPGHFAIGTEGQDEPTASVLAAELRPDGHIVVTATHLLTDDALGVKLKPNHGAEGMCGRGDDVLVAIEERGTLPDGARYAPLVHMHAGTITGVAKLRLTTDTGKISALACTTPDDVYAVERHYGVHRILHFSDPDKPTVVLDLDPILHGSRNIEGIARLPDGRFVLVNDNQTSKVEGPTELLVLGLRKVQPRLCVACSSRLSSPSRTRPLPTRRRSSRSKK